MFFPLFNAMREAKEQRCCNCFSPIRLVSLSVYLSLFLSHPYNKKEKHLALASFCVRVYVFFWMFVIVRGKQNKNDFTKKKKPFHTFFTHAQKKKIQ